MYEFFRTLHHIDKDITLAINSVHCPVSDWIWIMFSNKYIWFVMYAVIAFFLFRNLGWKKALVSLAAIVLTIVCCDQLGNLCKWHFERLRPSWDGEMLRRGLRVLVDKGTGISYGFYSAHAANALGFAICSLLCFKQDTGRSYRTYGTAIIIWGLLVGMSRIFVGMHFFGDVMTGYAVGTAVAIVFAALADFAIRRLKLRD